MKAQAEEHFLPKICSIGFIWRTLNSPPITSVAVAPSNSWSQKVSKTVASALEDRLDHIAAV